MGILNNIIRRLAHRIGWEIGSAVENVIWSIGIAVLLMCCCAFGVAAVAWQIVFRK